MSKKILIVDDEPDLMKVTCFRLEKAGFTVLSAIDGQQGLEIAAKEKPDLILLDVRLPRLGGIEVCLQLKKNEPLKHIPVILFTASAERVHDQLITCGAQDYIIKPFTAEELIEKIKKLTG